MVQSWRDILRYSPFPQAFSNRWAVTAAAISDGAHAHSLPLPWLYCCCIFLMHQSAPCWKQDIESDGALIWSGMAIFCLPGLYECCRVGLPWEREGWNVLSLCSPLAKSYWLPQEPRLLLSSAAADPLWENPLLAKELQHFKMFLFLTSICLGNGQGGWRRGRIQKIYSLHADSKSNYIMNGATNA